MITFTNTRRFRLKILACMLHPTWMAKYSLLILPAYFESEDEHDLAECLISYWNTYKRTPSDADDMLMLLENKITDNHRNLVHSVYIGSEKWDLSLASDRAVKFAQEQAAKLAVLESMDDINRGELESVVERLKQVMRVGRNLDYKGVDLIDDADQWLNSVNSNKVPTGMIHLDVAMGGGLAAGELGVFLAPPNYGKSMALIQVGYGAIGPISERNVVHFSLEMGAEIVAKRYGARITFRFPDTDISKYKQDFNDIANLMVLGKMKIFRVSGSVTTLRMYLDRVIDSGMQVGLIIVDYGDIVQPSRKRNDRWIELGDIFQDLRELGHDYECPVWTASQTRRSGINKEVITMADLAESFKKAAIADAIVALCQTVDEERANQCRLYLAKLRDGASRAMIRAKFYKKQQAIITTGFVHDT